MTALIDLPDWAYTMAPCLREGPYAAAGRYFVDALLKLPKGNYADLITIQCAYNLLHERDYLDRNWSIEPVSYFNNALHRLGDFAKLAKEIEPKEGYPHVQRPNFDDVKDETGSHYGNLFSPFQDEKYYVEPTEFLRDRLGRNGYPIEKFKEWRALDAGCGNGRYTVGLHNLGFKSVVGLDWSEINIADAERRKDARKLEGIDYVRGNVLDIPFPDNSFDFVLSNGVLHHTENPDQGVKELLRVLKPGGIGMIMLIPNPGGLHWQSQEILRVVLKDIDYGKARTVFDLLGCPANRRMFFLDHTMVPINIFYSKEDMEKVLTSAGACNLRFLKRGHDVDRVEWIYQDAPYAVERYGIGDNRYYFEKPL
jgi:ubiquinone/menaquinone biosynthesis C-methylase UbiE